jgi:hypothetical protein
MLVQATARKQHQRYEPEILHLPFAPPSTTNSTNTINRMYNNRSDRNGETFNYPTTAAAPPAAASGRL